MGWKTHINWSNSNYRDTILKTLYSNGNSVDHYMSTYGHEREEELIRDFNPKKYIIKKFDNSCKSRLRHERFKEVLDLFDENYDYYIMTRFDLEFSMECLRRCEIKQGSINVTSKHGLGEDRELVCDNFYLFERESLLGFRKFIGELPKIDDFYSLRLHRYENSPEFSFLIEGSYYSHNCPLWRIVR
jgi:hypothetical protein